MWQNQAQSDLVGRDIGVCALLDRPAGAQGDASDSEGVHRAGGEGDGRDGWQWECLCGMGELPLMRSEAKAGSAERSRAHLQAGLNEADAKCQRGNYTSPSRLEQMIVAWPLCVCAVV